MAAPTKMTGERATVYINKVPVAVGDFAFDLNITEVSQERLSNAYPRNFIGSSKVAIKFTNIDFDATQMMMATSSSTASSTRTVIADCDVSTNWEVTGTNAANSALTIDTSVKKFGTGALLVTNTGDASANVVDVSGNGSTWDLSGYHILEAYVRSSNAGDEVFEYFGFGESAISENTKAVNMHKADTWQLVTYDITDIADTSKNAVTKIGFKLDADSSANSIRIDRVVAYKGNKLGVGQYFDMDVVVEDSTDATKYYRYHMPNCFFLGQSLSIAGGANKAIEGPVTVGIEDASEIIETHSAGSLADS